MPQGSKEAPFLHHILTHSSPDGSNARGWHDILAYADDVSEHSKAAHPGVRNPGADNESSSANAHHVSMLR